MNKFLSLSVFGLVSANAFAQFTVDNLVALRVGDGVAALSSTSAQVTLDQFTPAGGFVNSTSFSNISLSGSATSEGSLYNFGTGVSFGGYAAIPGTAAIVSTSSNVTLRNGVIVPFSGGSPTLAPLVLAPTNPFNTGNIRSVALNGLSEPNNVPTRLIAAGSNTGVVNADLAGASQVASNSTTNIRVVSAIGDDVFYSTGSGTVGVYRVTGGATGTGLTPTLLFATTGSPYDFQRLSNGDYIYADDGTGATGGLRRWNSVTN